MAELLNFFPTCISMIFYLPMFKTVFRLVKMDDLRGGEVSD